MQRLTILSLFLCSCFADAAPVSDMTLASSESSESSDGASATSTTSGTTSADESDDGAHTSSGEWSTGTDTGGGASDGEGTPLDVGVSETENGSESSDDGAPVCQDLHAQCNANLPPCCGDYVCRQEYWCDYAVCVPEGDNCAVTPCCAGLGCFANTCTPS
jgi:hypothetical protein